MKTLLKISEMMPFLPTALKDAIHHVAKESGNKTDALELHRHTHSEKAKVNELDPASRKSLAYVSYRTQDRDDEIVIPKALKLDEFRKYASVLVNHNYSLLPVGSDEHIEADEYGIKALTVHADTGVGTMANVVWDLVRQGHLKGRSVGFVPTSYTKPGARDWDRVTNQLQSNWGEFDKAKAEKSISRIITGGVLLEHSFVSVPCNVDAELIGTVKAMHLDGKIIKQLGWEVKDGVLVNKAEAKLEPCVCDECGFVADAVAGSKCPECKTGDMKVKAKEKAIEITTITKTTKVGDVEENETTTTSKEIPLVDKDEAAKKKKKKEEEDKEAAEKEKGFHSRAVEKPNPHMPGGSFSACVLLMEDKGHETESAKKICGALQADAGGKGLTEVETKAVTEAKAYYTECVCDECGAKADTNPGEPCKEEGCKGKMRAVKEEKAAGIPCTCDECGAEDDCAPGSACQEADCTGVMRASKKAEKAIAIPVVKVIRPPTQIKVLYTPPDADLIAKGVSEAVEKTLARRTGRIL